MNTTSDNIVHGKGEKTKKKAGSKRSSKGAAKANHENRPRDKDLERTTLDWSVFRDPRGPA